MKNPKKSKIMKTKYFFLKIVIIALIFSCTVDDMSEEPVKYESIEIRAWTLIAEEFPEHEQGALEIYGTIRAKLTSGEGTDNRLLWERGEDNWKSVNTERTDIYDESIRQIFTLTAEEIKNGAEIELEANLLDKDPGNSSDYLGTESINVPVAELLAITDDGNPHNDLQLIRLANNGNKLLVVITFYKIEDNN